MWTGRGEGCSEGRPGDGGGGGSKGQGTISQTSDGDAAISYQHNSSRQSLQSADQEVRDRRRFAV